MAHIGQATNNSRLFWYNDHIGRLILTAIWKACKASPMDDNQLIIATSDTEVAIAEFKKYGYSVNF